MRRLASLDLAIISAFLLAVLGCGAWFSRRRRTADEFMAAGRNLPGWALALSIFGSYISSISFLANPGKSFSGNWNSFVFSLMTPLAALIAAGWFVGFYRRRGEVSAYEHLEHRFGLWARLYAVGCFLLTQLGRTGTILLLLAQVTAPWLDLSVPALIVMLGVLMTVYTLGGGMEAVVWTSVLQSAVLVVGSAAAVIFVAASAPGGWEGLLAQGHARGQFSLGSFNFRLTESTFWVVVFYGLVINLQNFCMDQSYVQRYVTARTDRGAAWSVVGGALLYVPTAAAFFLVGTALRQIYDASPAALPLVRDPSADADRAFPAFIAASFPAGLAGLTVAAVFAAALDSTLTNMATLTWRDLYQRCLRPGIRDDKAVPYLRAFTVGWGALATCAALAMIRAKAILDVWWQIAGVFSGGLLGLFLLGMRPRRRGSGAAAAAGVAAGVVAIVWLTLGKLPLPGWPSWLRNPFDPLMTAVLGTLAVLVVGGAMHAVSPAAAAGTALDVPDISETGVRA